MRARFNYFILVLGLGLILGMGCSRQKAPEPAKPETPQQTEVVPAPSEAPTHVAEAPAPVPPVPVEPAPAPAPEKPPEKIDVPAAVPFWERLSHPSEPAVPAVPKDEPLHVYYQKDPIPETWLAAWTAASHVAVVQSKFSEGTLPADGDLYLFTPELYPQVMAGPGALPLEKGWARAGLDPAFTGQPFDIGNLHTRPWRWTPYLLYGQTSRKAPWKDKYVSVLLEDPKSLWPDQIGLLAGLTLKDQKLSANPRDTESWITLYRSLQIKMRDKVATEAECWRRLQAGEIEITLLPATYKLMLPADAPASLDLAVPASGTLVYFEQIAVGSHTKKKESALALTDYLLKIDQQKRLLAKTGYFPVRIKPGTEAELGALHLTKKDWFELSEFLTNAPVLPKEEVVPAASAPAAAAPAVEKDAAKTEAIPATEKAAVPTP